jgi:ribonuclease BN (tRNA processing enzyme)
VSNSADRPEVLRLLRQLETLSANGDAGAFLTTLRTRLEEIPQDRLQWTLELLDHLGVSIDRDLLRSTVYSLLGDRGKGIEILVRWMYPGADQPESCWEGARRIADRDRIIEGLRTLSIGYDEDLRLVLEGRVPQASTNRAALLLKLIYYFGEADAPPVGQIVLAESRTLARQQNIAGLEPAQFCIEFPKMYSSSTPASFARDKMSIGGGYFLALGGYGCVIDPGYDFLDTFFNMGHSLNHVNGIIVTHFHDDHYASFPALLSLLFKKYKNSLTGFGNGGTGGSAAKVDVFLDRVTHQRFASLVEPENSPYLAEPTVLNAGKPEQFALGPNATLMPLPTCHALFSGGETDTGFGIAVSVPKRDTQLIITGDTGWTSEIENTYRRLPTARHQVLVAHVSTCDLNEVPHLGRSSAGFCGNHLGVHGLGKAIEATRATAVLLSEVGEEFRPVRNRFIEHVRTAYGPSGVNVCDWAQYDRCWRYPI